MKKGASVKKGRLKKDKGRRKASVPVPKPATNTDAREIPEDWRERSRVKERGSQRGALVNTKGKKTPILTVTTRAITHVEPGKRVGLGGSNT